MKYQLSQENVLRGGDSENLRNVTYDVASRANSHLQKVSFCFLLFLVANLISDPAKHHHVHELNTL